MKEQNAEYRRVVASQQKLINALQKQLSDNIAGTTRFKDKRVLKDRSLEMFAKRLIKETNSTISTETLKSRLTNIFNYVAGNDVDTDFGGRLQADKTRLLKEKQKCDMIYLH